MNRSIAVNEVHVASFHLWIVAIAAGVKTSLSRGAEGEILGFSLFHDDGSNDVLILSRLL